MVMTKSILLATSDASVRDMWARPLAEAGLQVLLAGTGAEALKFAENEAPHYVLAELHLPDFSGEELKERMAQLSPETRVIVVSSLAAVLNSGDTQRFGSSDFVLNQRELLDLIARTVENQLTPPAPPPDDRMKRCLTETIDVLVGLLEVNDPFFGGNSHLTMEYARSIAEEMKLPEEMVDEIVVASLLHDIGRIGVRGEILTTNEITESDLEMIKSHCENGAKILETIDFPWKIRSIIIHHHEWYNGRGYPGGMKGREIPVGARILAVADAFASMTANRPHRKSLTKEEAIRELHRKVGSQFDPEMVELFTGVVEKKFYFRGLGAKPKVLLVDDQIDYLVLLKLKLVNEGFDVATTCSAEEALRLMAAEKPDLAVIDVMMPGMDGLSLFSKMRESESEPWEVPVIFLSANTESQVKVEAFQLGVDDYLIKPVDLKELAARIRNIIRRNALARRGTAAAPVAGVVGDLENMGIPDIVQTLHLGSKNACVTLKGKGGFEGRIYFKDGRIRHCEHADLTGQEAFYALLHLQNGKFIIAHGQTTDLATIDMDTMRLVLDGLQRLEQEKNEKSLI